MDMEIWFPLIEMALNTILKVFVPIIAIALVGWYRKTVQNDLVRLIIEDGVLYAQQVFWQAGGAERLDAAKQRILSALNEAGIKISEEMLDTLIEATLKRLKIEFEEAWNFDENEG
jgi:hypothetical protein